MCFFRCFEISKPMTHAARVDGCAVVRDAFLRPLTNALQAELVSVALVVVVLVERCFSKVCPPVVGSDMVDMVHKLSGISARHELEYDSVHRPSVLFPVSSNGYSEIAIRSHRRDALPGIASVPSDLIALFGKMLNRAFFPSKEAGLGVVVEALPKIVGRWQSAISHVVTPVSGGVVRSPVDASTSPGFAILGQLK